MMKGNVKTQGHVIIYLKFRDHLLNFGMGEVSHFKFGTPVDHAKYYSRE